MEVSVENKTRVLESYLFISELKVCLTVHIKMTDMNISSSVRRVQFRKHHFFCFCFLMLFYIWWEVRSALGLFYKHVKVFRAKQQVRYPLHSLQVFNEYKNFCDSSWCLSFTTCIQARCYRNMFRQIDVSVSHHVAIHHDSDNSRGTDMSDQGSTLFTSSSVDTKVM